MLLALRQVEKLHDTKKGFVVFLDLRKGFWLVLAKLGVPAKLVSIILSVHEDRTPTVCVLSP